MTMTFEILFSTSKHALINLWSKGKFCRTLLSLLWHKNELCMVNGDQVMTYWRRYKIFTENMRNINNFVLCSLLVICHERANYTYSAISYVTCLIIIGTVTYTRRIWRRIITGSLKFIAWRFRKNYYHRYYPPFWLFEKLKTQFLFIL